MSGVQVKLTQSRYADLSSGPARLVLLVLACLIVYGVFIAQDLTWSKENTAPGGGDSDNYQRIAERVRNGEDYYQAANLELSSNNYRTSSVFDFRLPTLAFLMALVPKKGMAQFLLGAMALLNMFLWLRYWLEQEKSVLNASLGSLLLLGSSMPCFLRIPSFFHEVWAGTLVSISLVTYLDRKWAISVAAGIAALCFRELALPFVLIMLGFALYERRFREVLAWLAGLAGFALYLGIHASLVAEVAQESALTGSRWLSWGGWTFLLRTAQSNAFLMLSPKWVTAVAFPLALLGLVGWKNAISMRIITTTAAFSLAFLVIGQSFNVYWGLMYAHILALGMAYALPSLVDLTRASLAQAAPD